MIIIVIIINKFSVLFITINYFRYVLSARQVAKLGDVARTAEERAGSPGIWKLGAWAWAALFPCLRPVI